MCCSRALGGCLGTGRLGSCFLGPLYSGATSWPLSRVATVMLSAECRVLVRGTEPQVRGGLGLGGERRRERRFMRRMGECSLGTRRADMPAYFKRKSDLKLWESPVPPPPPVSPSSSCLLSFCPLLSGLPSGNACLSPQGLPHSCRGSQPFQASHSPGPPGLLASAAVLLPPLGGPRLRLHLGPQQAFFSLGQLSGAAGDRGSG